MVLIYNQNRPSGYWKQPQPKGEGDTQERERERDRDHREREREMHSHTHTDRVFNFLYKCCVAMSKSRKQSLLGIYIYI